MCAMTDNKRKRDEERTEPVDVMIDIETFGTRAGCVICSIAAQTFSVKTGPGKQHFYERIDTKTCEEIGLQIEKETFDWWKSLPADSVASKEIFSPRRTRFHIRKVLEDFRSWLRSNHVKFIWAKGPDFDCTILAEAYRRYEMKPPWNYYDTCDVRTVMRLTKSLPKSITVVKSFGTLHYAPDDVTLQILQILPCLEFMEKVKSLGNK